MQNFNVEAWGDEKKLNPLQKAISVKRCKRMMIGFLGTKVKAITWKGDHLESHGNVSDI